MSIFEKQWMDQTLIGPAGPQGVAGSQGNTGLLGPAGPQGIPGIQGSIGPKGEDGSKYIYDAGAPAVNVGREGDFYIDTASSANSLFQKQLGVWEFVANLRGDIGPIGPLGPQGIPGLDGDKFTCESTSNIGMPVVGDGIIMSVNTHMAYIKHMPLLVSSKGSTAWFTASVLSYNKVTGDLTLIVDSIFGYGAHSDWEVSITGAKGESGSQGLKGDTGEKGDRGLAGVIGATGLMGPAGIQGPKGEDGGVGEQGMQGITGEQGILGPQGYIGPQGIQGPVGERGPDGLLGPQGFRGPEGPQGPQGIQGFQGIRGPAGAKGPDGNPGGFTTTDTRSMDLEMDPIEGNLTANVKISAAAGNIIQENEDGLHAEADLTKVVIKDNAVSVDTLGSPQAVHTLLQNQWTPIAGVDILGHVVFHHGQVINQNSIDTGSHPEFRSMSANLPYSTQVTTAHGTSTSSSYLQLENPVGYEDVGIISLETYFSANSGDVYRGAAFRHVFDAKLQTYVIYDTINGEADRYTRLSDVIRRDTNGDPQAVNTILQNRYEPNAGVVLLSNLRIQNGQVTIEQVQDVSGTAYTSTAVGSPVSLTSITSKGNSSFFQFLEASFPYAEDEFGKTTLQTFLINNSPNSSRQMALLFEFDAKYNTFIIFDNIHGSSDRYARLSDMPSPITTWISYASTQNLTTTQRDTARKNVGAQGVSYKYREVNTNVTEAQEFVIFTANAGAGNSSQISIQLSGVGPGNIDMQMNYDFMVNFTKNDDGGTHWTGRLTTLGYSNNSDISAVIAKFRMMKSEGGVVAITMIPGVNLNKIVSLRVESMFDDYSAEVFQFIPNVDMTELAYMEDTYLIEICHLTAEDIAGVPKAVSYFGDYTLIGSTATGTDILPLIQGTSENCAAIFELKFTVSGDVNTLIGSAIINYNAYTSNVQGGSYIISRTTDVPGYGFASFDFIHGTDGPGNSQFGVRTNDAVSRVFDVYIRVITSTEVLQYSNATAIVGPTVLGYSYDSLAASLPVGIPAYSVSLDSTGKMVKNLAASAGYPRQVVFRFPTISDSILLGYSDTNVSLSKVKVAVNGGTSIAYTIKRMDPTSSSTAGGVLTYDYSDGVPVEWVANRSTLSGKLDIITSASPAPLVAGSKVWVEISDVVATVIDVTFIIEI